MAIGANGDPGKAPATATMETGNNQDDVLVTIRRLSMTVNNAPEMTLRTDHVLRITGSVQVMYILLSRSYMYATYLC